MRSLTRIVLIGAATAAVACASAGAPPGGPPDELPPAVVSFSPESGTVNFRGRAVVIEFNETVTDRGTGASALEALIQISPRDGEPRIAWGRDEIAVRPRDGWRANTAYTVIVAPGIADLRGNSSKATRRIVFSTGPEIPAGSISGRAFDWPGERTLGAGWIEALRASDSAVFVAPIDSTGQFTVGPLGRGDYVVRGYSDQNANRVLDRTEAWDTVRVVIDASPVAGVELLAAPRDTFPARLASVAVRDSLHLDVEFDKLVDPALVLRPEHFAVTRADSTPIRVVGVLTSAAFDSAARVATLATAPAPTAPTPPPAARADTVTRPARPSRPAPPRKFVLRLAMPLEPGATYRVTATGVRTLMGRNGSSTRLITVPRAAAPRDSSQAPRDSTTRPAARPPASPPRR